MKSTFSLFALYAFQVLSSTVGPPFPTTNGNNSNILITPSNNYIISSLTANNAYQITTCPQNGSQCNAVSTVTEGTEYSWIRTAVFNTNISYVTLMNEMNKTNHNCLVFWVSDFGQRPNSWAEICF